MFPKGSCPLHTAMGAWSAPQTWALQLWHARGKVLPRDLAGASALLVVGWGIRFYLKGSFSYTC